MITADFLAGPPRMQRRADGRAIPPGEYLAENAHDCRLEHFGRRRKCLRRWIGQSRQGQGEPGVYHPRTPVTFALRANRAALEVAPDLSAAKEEKYTGIRGW
jgi:hypothetical protein